MKQLTLFDEPRPEDHAAQVEIRVVTVRQPWPWLMFHLPENLRKDVENRRNRIKPGRLYIHAGKQITPPEIVRETTDRLGITLPDPVDLQLGGIVGRVEVVGVLQHQRHKANTIGDQFDRCEALEMMRDAARSPWFENTAGGCGWVLTDHRPLPYLPLRGQQGIFKAQVSRDYADR